MARHYKKWSEHSARWQRDAQRKGMSEKRWDGWLKLSEKTRKDSDPRKYAAGQSIAEQHHEKKVNAAIAKIRQVSSNTVRTSVVIRNVNRMTPKDLEWTLKASPAQIRARASQKTVTGYASNPWWYR